MSAGDAAAPVLDARVRIENLRLMLFRASVLEGALLDARDRDRAASCRQTETTSCSGPGLSASHIAGSTSMRFRSGNMSHHRVEHLAVVLVRVETVVEEFAEEAAALRTSRTSTYLDEATESAAYFTHDAVSRTATQAQPDTGGLTTA